jgi:hypothetical protein
LFSHLRLPSIGVYINLSYCLELSGPHSAGPLARSIVRASRTPFSFIVPFTTTLWPTTGVMLGCSLKASLRSTLRTSPVRSSIVISLPSNSILSESCQDETSGAALIYRRHVYHSWSSLQGDLRHGRGLRFGNVITVESLDFYGAANKDLSRLGTLLYEFLRSHLSKTYTPWILI